MRIKPCFWWAFIKSHENSHKLHFPLNFPLFFEFPLFCPRRPIFPSSWDFPHGLATLIRKYCYWSYICNTIRTWIQGCSFKEKDNPNGQLIIERVAHFAFRRRKDFFFLLPILHFFRDRFHRNKDTDFYNSSRTCRNLPLTADSVIKVIHL